MEYTSLSPLAMFVNAGPVGKSVMLTLVWPPFTPGC